MKKFAGEIISLYRSKLVKERGSIRKDPGGKLTVALAYPNYYRIGMSNLGFQVVYQLLNRRKDVLAERVFLPDDREMFLYKQGGGELRSLESQSPVRKFDLLAFSLSFENDYLNVLKIIDLAKIPPFREDRSAPSPLLVAGGITTFLNPEPLAPFMDFFLLGEAEAIMNSFLDLLLEFSPLWDDRNELLQRMSANMTGLYVPSLYRPEYHDDGSLKSFLPQVKEAPEKIKVARCVPLGSEPSVSSITSQDIEFSERILIEVSRGCGRACRFCAAGYVYRPPRVYPEENLKAAIEGAAERCKRFGLLGTAVSDFPGIEDLTALIVERGCDVSLSSLRVDALSEVLVEQLNKAEQKTVSVAPEAGTERLRRVINKHLAEEQIMKTARLVSRVGRFSLRLYFLIGLPTETGEDVSGILGLVKKIKHNMIKEAAKKGRIGQIKLSVNCFVPKPFTPFQWFGLEEVASLKEKQKWLKRAIGKEGGIKIHFDLPKWAYIQTLLSKGDRRTSKVLYMAHQVESDWKKAFRSWEVNPDFFVYRPLGTDETLPWDFIDHGLRKDHLLEEYWLAQIGQESEGCRVGKCFQCGVCKPKVP